MKKLLFIIVFLLSLGQFKAQEIHFKVLDHKGEFIVESDFKVIISAETIEIGGDKYFVHTQKDGHFLLMKDGFCYELSLTEDKMELQKAASGEMFVYYKN